MPITTQSGAAYLAIKLAPGSYLVVSPRTGAADVLVSQGVSVAEALRSLDAALLAKAEQLITLTTRITKLETFCVSLGYKP